MLKLVQSDVFFSNKDKNMDILGIIKSRRSIRRFRQEKLDRGVLIDLVDAARLAPAGANVQSLEYIIVDDPELCEKVFGNLAWAGHVKGKRKPGRGQRPMAYIVVLIDEEIKKDAAVDAAAAIENVLIGAHGLGIGSCWLGAIDRGGIASALGVPGKYHVDSVIALGIADEEPMVEDCKGDDTRYYLDGKDVLHVPKRPLKQITHGNKYGESI